MHAKSASLMLLGCALLLALPTSSAFAQPDASNTSIISSDTAGVWTATKRVDVYAEGNPLDPFPGDGNFTYVYTVTNDPGSLITIGGLLVNLVDPACLPATIGFIAGPLDPEIVSEILRRGQEIIESRFLSIIGAIGSVAARIVIDRGQFVQYHAVARRSGHHR